MSIHDPLYTWEDHEACWRMNYRGSLGNYVTNNYYHENADFFDKSIQKRMHTDNTILYWKYTVHSAEIIGILSRIFGKISWN